MADETLQEIATRNAKSTREFIEDCEARVEAFTKAGNAQHADMLRDLIDKHLKPLLGYEERNGTLLDFTAARADLG